MTKTKTICRCILLATILMTSVTSYAQTLVGGLYYSFDAQKKEATVEQKPFDVNLDLNDNYYKGDVVIPETVKYGNVTYTVTKIGYWSFEHSNIVSLKIPATVREIPDQLFGGCKYLEKVVVDKNNKVFDSRDNCNAVIYTETNELIAGCKNTVIPSSVTRIANFGFYEINVSSIVIPNTVTSIGENAFMNCIGLGDFVIPSSVNQIQQGAFLSSYGLTSVVIPEGITEIADAAFNFCEDLRTVILPNTLEEIGEGAFGNCYSLSEVVIPASVTSIGDGAFRGSNNLTSITFLSATPPEMGAGIFGGTFFLDEVAPDLTIVIHVPKGSKDAYEKVAELQNHIIIDDMPAPTGISVIDGETAPAIIYSIDGKRVNSPKKGGLYIINGKKSIY